MRPQSKILTSLVLLVGIVVGITGLSGCGSAVKPAPPVILETIDTTESAVLLPIVGDNSQQVSAQTESFFKQNLVYSKQIRIPVYWQVTDLRFGYGKWMPSARLIKVDRKLVNRTWTKDPGSGTSTQDQSIEAEDINSIGFRAHMTCTAGVDEPDVPKFLYRFKQASLSQVMDDNIRPMVSELFVAECAKRPMLEILRDRQHIMDNVRSKVIMYFKEMGIDIQVLGLVGELEYVNPETQHTIDRVFQANQDRQAAASKAETARLLATPANMEYMRLQLKQRELEIQAQAVNKWKGDVPTYMSGSGTGPMMFLNAPKQ